MSEALRPAQELSAPRWQYLFNFGSVYIIWGSTYLAIRFADETMPPLLMGGVRFLIAGGILFAYALIHDRAWPTWQNWRSTSIVGAFLLLGGNGIIILTEKVVPSALAALLVSISPIWMILIEWLRPRGVRPTLPVIAGLLLGFAGVVLLISPNLSSTSHIPLLPLLIIPLSSLSWAAGSVYSRHARMPASPMLGNGMEMLAGGLLLTVVGTVTGEWSQAHISAISAKSLWALIFLIGFGSIVGFSSYIWMLRHSPLALASTYAYVNPVVAVFLGWALAGEAITTQTLIAAAVIIGAVVIINTFRSHAQPAPAKTVGNEGEAEPSPLRTIEEINPPVATAQPRR